VALAVSRNGHFGAVSSVGSAQDAGRKGSVGARQTVRVTLLEHFVLFVVEEAILNTLAIGKVVARRAGKALSADTARTRVEAGLASVLAGRVLFEVVAVRTHLIALACQEAGPVFAEHAVTG